MSHVSAGSKSLANRFIHDCDACEFRGNYKGHDIYRHGDTIIMRFGNDGPDYHSFDRQIIACLPADNDFHVALQLATD